MVEVGEDAAWIIIINTRWHVDDLCGRILPGWDGKSGFYESKDGERWYVLNLPMEAEQDDPLEREPGDVLWPEWFGKRPGWVQREKAIQGPRNWNAAHQLGIKKPPRDIIPINSHTFDASAARARCINLGNS